MTAFRKWIAHLLVFSMLLSIIPMTEAKESVDETDSEGISLEETADLEQPFDLTYPELVESNAAPYSDTHILIKLEPGQGLTAGLQKAGIHSLTPFLNLRSGIWYKAVVSGSVETALEEVRGLNEVLVAEYDYVTETDAITDSSSVVSHVSGNGQVYDQWYLKACGIQKSWQQQQNPGKGIVVAVIDTGVDYDHVDLKSNMWVNTGEKANDGKDNDGNGYVDDYYGVNLISGSGSAMDDNGHGTHVAGIIAAANNNTGMVGIAYSARIMPIKAGMASGEFAQSDIATAVAYAHEMGADVINMSFGNMASSVAVTEALEQAYTDCVLVASAGNDGAPNEGQGAMPNYPAALPYVLGVMSVDDNGEESAFTNYDTVAFNSVEYEVYAPGENILSTLPGNQYAKWSGTSMAAPVVSAMAAICRAAYADRDAYPTKFIYGQIVNSGTIRAECCGHGTHNLPNIVNVYAAMTNIPKPEISVMDYTIFDTAGLNGSSVNDGDGVVDAGETVALGFTLRNRWGMSSNTKVTVDTYTQGGVADPYVTVDGWEKSTINYGSIGTYSESDCGRIIENDAFVGWEDPFYLEVSTDCPNDYVVLLNVTVTYKNGLDPTDKTTYTTNETLRLTVRKGIVLPNRIKQDMTLTGDQYYIIDKNTLIMEGVTVTAEAGTKIQFWTNNEKNIGKASYVAVLTVEGYFICNGTPENPVEIFPSSIMDKFRIEIKDRNNGRTELYHTNIVNPFLDIAVAENCEYTQTYHNEPLYYFIVDGSTVSEWYGMAEYHFDSATQCVFYRLGHYAYSAYIYSWEEIWELGTPMYQYSTLDNCIFVDCKIDLAGFLIIQNCVFYGNNNYLDGEVGSTSEVKIGKGALSKYERDGYNSYFYQNAILNRLVDENKSKWMCISSDYSEDHTPIPIYDNYWGTTNPTLIEEQILDFDDQYEFGDLDASIILTEAPSNVWPFVVDAGVLDRNGNKTDTVGTGKARFYVEFNRDMDTSIPLNVRFGSAYPYADYRVEGEYVSPRRWEGAMNVATVVESGYLRFSIGNGQAADEPLKLYEDWGRFQFKIDSTQAQSLSLQAALTAGGVRLNWTQDDFDTLAGYNVYRAERDIESSYEKINDTLIPADTKTYLDTEVEDGTRYYYIFKVVQTNSKESAPSGKAMIKYQDNDDHDWTAWASDLNGHSRSCVQCGETEQGAHSWSGSRCAVCGREDFILTQKDDQLILEAAQVEPDTGLVLAVYRKDGKMLDCDAAQSGTSGVIQLTVELGKDAVEYRVYYLNGKYAPTSEPLKQAIS